MTTTKAQRDRPPRAAYRALPVGPMLAGAAGMCGPVLAGALTDHTGAGMLAIRPADAALGCLIAIGAGYLPWSPRQGSGRK
ncbi:hypothetical protein ACQP1V_13485 [Microtetraspora malaysiensis]|uniref:hypothetical protein n=1 Tax=Microtetraspora malaysiensis TaxID=161358 RepID=UPI003D8A525E